MSKESTQNYKGLNAIIVVLLFVCLITGVYRFISSLNKSTISIVLSFIFIVTCVAGLIYALYGYKKNAAMYYKTFMFFFSITNIMQAVTDIIKTKDMSFESNISGVLRIVICIIALILTFAKNLGKSSSMTLAYVMLITGSVNIIRLFVLYHSDLPLFISNIRDLSMIVIGFLFVIEKYIDKESRGAR